MSTVRLATLAMVLVLSWARNVNAMANSNNLPSFRGFIDEDAASSRAVANSRAPPPRQVHQSPQDRTGVLVVEVLDSSSLHERTPLRVVLDSSSESFGVERPSQAAAGDLLDLLSASEFLETKGTLDEFSPATVPASTDLIQAAKTASAAPPPNQAGPPPVTAAAPVTAAPVTAAPVTAVKPPPSPPTSTAGAPKTAGAAPVPAVLVPVGTTDATPPAVPTLPTPATTQGAPPTTPTSTATIVPKAELDHKRWGFRWSETNGEWGKHLASGILLLVFFCLAPVAYCLFVVPASPVNKAALDGGTPASESGGRGS